MERAYEGVERKGSHFTLWMQAACFQRPAHATRAEHETQEVAVRVAWPGPLTPRDDILVEKNRAQQGSKGTEGALA